MDAEDLLNYDDEELDSELLASEASAESARKTNVENLKISVDNPGIPDADVTFIKLENVEQTVEESSDQQAQTQVNVAFGSGAKLGFPGKKRYENKSGGFETGLNLTSEEAMLKRQERARRFGMEMDTSTAGGLDVYALYSSLGLSDECISEPDSHNLRAGVIMLRGTNELSTADIWSYFKSYPPLELEWIDDSSCNIVFSDNDTCNRALWNLSKPIQHPEAAALNTNSTAASDTPDDGVKKEVDDDDMIDLNDESHDKPSDNMDSQDPATAISDTSATIPNTSTNTAAGDADDGGVSIDEHLLPPGRWRLAQGHPKSKRRMFMRIATTADVKQKGAEKKSEYYRKYGNPNYGGMKGLISNSHKRRYRKERDRQIEQEAHDAVSGGRAKVVYDDDDLFGSADALEDSPVSSGPLRERLGVAGVALKNRKRKADSDGEDIEQEINELLERTEPKQKRMPMMKMAADEEEAKIAAEKKYAEALVQTLDVRRQLERRRHHRALMSDVSARGVWTRGRGGDRDSARNQEWSDEEEGEIVDDKSRVQLQIARPDLRSRLSRGND